MAHYIRDTGLAAALRSGLDDAQDTRPSSLLGFRDECPVSSAVALLDAQIHTTLVRATEQVARAIELAAALLSAHDGAQDSPPSSLPGICDERPVSPIIALIDTQVHTTSVRATEQAARTTEYPPTTLPAPTEPAAPMTAPAPGASSTSSLSSAPNNTQSRLPQPPYSQRCGARRK